MRNKRYTNLARREMTITSAVSDEAYNEETWNGDAHVAPSKNAVRDIIEALLNSTFVIAATPDIIGSTTPNVIYSLNKEIYKTSSADSPLTALQCSGTIVSNYGMTDAAMDIVLPTAVEGLAFLFILPTVRARAVRLRAGANDLINLNGVDGTDNGYVGVASGYTAKTRASVYTVKSSGGGFDWCVDSIVGGWAVL
jgi:hypothetical protein